MSFDTASEHGADIAISADQYERLLAALPHPILVVRSNDHIVYANEAAEDFFEASQAFLARQKIADIVPFASPLLTLLQQARATGANINEYGVDLSTPRIGTQKLVDIHCGQLPEQPDHIVVMLHKRAMARMIERQFTHRAAARSVSGLATVLAHEIKNPLSGIRGAAQLLEANLSDADRALTQLICVETDRICKLVDRMEVFSDERPLGTEPVNIHAVLDHVRLIAENGFASHVHIEQDYDPSLPPVAGNRDKLIQALLNLVKNAAEAISPEQPGGRILLQTAYRPGVRLTLPGSESRLNLPMMILVEDNGSGIPEGMAAHLFDPFVSSKHTGTGLGLALVAKIVRDHGGLIECDSQPKQTQFRMLLPCQ